MKIQRWLIPLFAATILAMSIIPINYAVAEKETLKYELEKKGTVDKIKNKGRSLVRFS